MQRLFPILLGGILLMTGCGFGSGIESDFKPTVGRATVPGNLPAGEGPFDKRLMTAISYDGLEYLPTDDGWITDQANVPDMVQTDDGLIYLYYSGWIVGGETNKSAVAISDDNGKSWALKNIVINDMPKLAPAVDPDIVLLDDGTFRLYFTSGDGTSSGIYYAEGTDGINFTYINQTVKPIGTNIIDSTTFRIRDEWHMYAMADESIETLWHLISDDGINWEITRITSFPIDGKPYMPSNGVWIDGKFHLFMFNPGSGEVRSKNTTDGYNWNVDDGVRIGPLADGRIVKDPTILKLDNSYLMIYVTTIPETE